MSFGARLRSFGLQVGGLGGPSWRFGWLIGVYVGSCEAQMGDLGPTWVQLEASWRQLGATMGST